jgi:uncharacterized protein YkwD
MPTDLPSVRRGIAIAAAVAALAASGLAASASSAMPQARADESSGLTALERTVVARINEIRQARGLYGLRVNRRLAAAADFHSRDMGRRGYFAHSSADGTVFWRRIQRFYASRGFRSWSVGENLLWASDTYAATFAVRQWMRSPPHRKNILTGAWREIGIGAVYFERASGEYEGRAVTIVTADFGARS